MSKKRKKIIYVDASIKKDKAILSLVHKINNNGADNVVITMEFKNEFISKSQNAEIMAILFGISYARFNSLKNCIILSDSETSVNNKSLRKFLEENKIRCIWIPREINLADNIKSNAYEQKEEMIKIFSEVFFSYIRI